MGKYFGTDGARGRVNETLTLDMAVRIGRYLGWHYGKEKRARIVIGKDTRLSGDMFEMGRRDFDGRRCIPAWRLPDTERVFPGAQRII